MLLNFISAAKLAQIHQEYTAYPYSVLYSEKHLCVFIYSYVPIVIHSVSQSHQNSRSKKRQHTLKKT